MCARRDIAECNRLCLPSSIDGSIQLGCSKKKKKKKKRKAVPLLLVSWVLSFFAFQNSPDIFNQLYVRRQICTSYSFNTFVELLFLMFFFHYYLKWNTNVQEKIDVRIYKIGIYIYIYIFVHTDQYWNIFPLLAREFKSFLLLLAFIYYWILGTVWRRSTCSRWREGY